MSDPAQLSASPREETEKRALVSRIVETARFRGAPRIREFLLFISDLALSGRAAEISESLIGTEVFHRVPGYDTGSDNIVRVTARQLRAKLLEYFESEGHNEAWRVEIPKGSYVPVFHRCQPAPPVPVSPAAPNRWRTAALLLAVCVVLLSAAAIWLGRRAPAPGASRAMNRSIIDLVVRPDQRTLIVLADASMVYLQQFSGRVLSLEEYANRDFRRLDTPSPEVRAILETLAQSQLTSVADIGLVTRVLRSRSAYAGNIDVRHARSITARSLKEDNVMLIGGLRSNPWVSLFEDRLNFRFRFGKGDAAATIENVSPKPGEAPEYRSGGGRAYARVAVLPNASANRNILLIAGGNIEATEAAAEFATSPHLAGLAAAIGVAALSDTTSFEVLLETSAAGGAAKDSRIAASRLYRP